MPTLAELAEDAAAYTPLWPGVDRVVRGRVCLLFLEWLTFVQRIRLETHEVEAMLGDVRARMAARGRTKALWWVGAGSRPDDSADCQGAAEVGAHDERGRARRV